MNLWMTDADESTDVEPDRLTRLTPELVLVGAAAADEATRPDPRPALRRRPPLPTLHLAAHEIVRFAKPTTVEPA